MRYNIIRVEQHASYGVLPYEQLINRADVVFSGKLLNVSPSKWNQDSGKYWSDESALRTATPLQFHTLQFAVSEFIIDKIGAKSQETIEVVIIGPSPLDGNADYSLSTGDYVVVFAGKTEMIWQGGQMRPIIEVLTAPEFAFFVQSSDSGGFYIGKVVYDLGKGNFETRNISLPLQDIVSQVQSIAQNQPSP